MGRVRKITTGDRPPLKVNEEHLAFEPATDTTAARLTVVHLWSGLPHGPNPARQRHAVTIAVVISSIIVGSKTYFAKKDATDRYNEILGGLRLVPAATEVGIVVARDHLETVTGQRFWHCPQCRDVLRIGALWCETCRTPTPHNPATAEQHAARVAAGA